MAIVPYLLRQKSPAAAAIDDFKNIISKGDLWHPRENVSFVFLCGANIQEGVPSKRRQMIQVFAERQLNNVEVFLAEKVFDVLKAEGHKNNILDVENDISEFADKIVIILESESAFCELGAFTIGKEIRKKIIVINDVTFKDSQSFINNGPIKAIKETVSNKNILFYKMQKDGIARGDGIGKTFNELYKLLENKVTARRSRVTGFDPTKNFNKESIRLLHDIIFLMGPLYYREISIIVEKIFEKPNKGKLQNQLGLLKAINQIKFHDGLYQSVNRNCYFEYDSLDRDAYLATFKTMYFRYDKSRMQ